ncbi:MAG: hypothetical protein MK105_02295 [Crocinitomicaceae bacterium]|nr:hypothetical protein [Crocinitomicaceae bacterium]
MKIQKVKGINRLIYFVFSLFLVIGCTNEEIQKDQLKINKAFILDEENPLNPSGLIIEVDLYSPNGGTEILISNISSDFEIKTELNNQSEFLGSCNKNVSMNIKRYKFQKDSYLRVYFLLENYKLIEKNDVSVKFNDLEVKYTNVELENLLGEEYISTNAFMNSVNGFCD